MAARDLCIARCRSVRLAWATSSMARHLMVSRPARHGRRSRTSWSSATFTSVKSCCPVPRQSAGTRSSSAPRRSASSSRYHASRRRDGRPWRLVIAGDLFDFMSRRRPGAPRPAGEDRRRAPLRPRPRRPHSASIRMRAHLRDPAGRCSPTWCSSPPPATRSTSSSATTTSSCSRPRSCAELASPARARRRERRRALARIRVVPWFVYVPGVAWIEHGHVYDEGCSFEFNLAPTDPKDGRILTNADYAAIALPRRRRSPEIDPHGIEEWSFWGFMQYGWGIGAALVRAALGRLRSLRVVARSRAHRASLVQAPRRSSPRASRAAREVAAAGGITVETALGDRSPRAHADDDRAARRLGRMLMLDRFGVGIGVSPSIILAADPLAARCGRSSARASRSAAPRICIAGSASTW